MIYADPPWRYAQKNLRGTAERHYPTMSMDELCALPVAELAAPDCALFLWATFPQLPEALRLIKAWGFQYKSVAFVWLKKNRKADSWFYGLGFWTRANAEVCLLATRGRPRRQAANVHQFIISPIEGHSKKPEEAREKIKELAKGNCAVIYLTEQLAKDMEDVISRYKDELRPAIILIPGRQGSLGIGKNNIQRAIERAVGADIL